MVGLNKTEKRVFGGKTFYLFGGEHNSKKSAEKVAEYTARGGDINGRPHYVRIVEKMGTSTKFGGANKLRSKHWYVYVREKTRPKPTSLAERNKKYGFK
jgi:hypothetical protein